jgi:hypothetical protein
MLRIAAALSLIVVLCCAIWWERVTAGDGPDQSVDFRPLGPIVVGIGLLTAIWVVAIFLSSVAAYRRGNRLDDDQGL